ncbi:MAG: peptidyl-prolyl cis-trans isomerase [Acidobacteria bacterium]|nr:peptidyl-prolyl cis-trans isomerase [Acidobacteriota bacterium]
MTTGRGRRATSFLPRLFLDGLAAAAAGLLISLAIPASPAAGAEDRALATYRGGAVTRSEFEGFQKFKKDAAGYRELLEDRPALRAALMRQALLEVVGILARENRLQERADFKARVKQYEDGQLAALWGRKVRAEVSVSDADLDRMVPELEDEVLVHWASFPSEEEAAKFAAAIRAGAKFAAAAGAAQVAAPMVGETRVSPGGQTHFSAASLQRILVLAKGEVSAPLSESIGWYVVQAIDRAGAKERRAQQREEMRAEVLRTKREQAYAGALAGLRAKAKIVIDEKALAAADPGAGRAVATVNGEKISFSPQEQHGFPKHGGMDQILRKDLDKQIDELLAAQEARRLKLAAREPGFAERLGYFSLEQLAELYREQVFKSFSVGEEEVRDYYARNREMFEKPAMVRVRQIVLQSRFLAERYRADLIAGRAVFEELAKRESIDRRSAVVGGDQGWVAESNIREELRPFVEALRPGEISVPVDVGGNLYLLKLESRAEPEPIPYEKVREKVRPRALLAKQSDSYQEFLARKQQELKVKLDEKAIDALVAAGP